MPHAAKVLVRLPTAVVKAVGVLLAVLVWVVVVPAIDATTDLSRRLSRASRAD
ncbi:MAG TPA: hypothetical protein VE596_07980 [Gaiellaceae bacterium]|nr:hypothetical protein [Gaiellaceae bacterium]